MCVCVCVLVHMYILLNIHEPVTGMVEPYILQVGAKWESRWVGCDGLASVRIYLFKKPVGPCHLKGRFF